MRIEIQATNFRLKPKARSFLLKRLNYAFRRTSDFVQLISMRLSDVNGPRGGVDKSCLVRIRMPGQSDVVVENTETNLNLAVHSAIRRARRSVLRQMKKQRNHNRWRLKRGDVWWDQLGFENQF